MAILVAVVVLVGVLCLLNLLLTLGVIRRLRELAERADSSSDAPALLVGQQVPEFTATTTAGEPVSHRSFSDDTLVAFLMPNCGPCREQLPELVKLAGGWAGGRDRVLAVIVGEPGAAATYVETLAPVARIVVEDSQQSSIVTAFAVSGFPLFGVVDGTGRVLSSALAATDVQLMDATSA